MNIWSNIGSNPIFLLILAFTIVAQILIIFFGGSAFKVVFIPVTEWIICISCGVVTLAVGFFVRMIPSLPLQNIMSTDTQESTSEVGRVRRYSSDTRIIAILGVETGCESKGHILWDQAIRQTKLRVRVINAFKPRINRKLLDNILRLRQ